MATVFMQSSKARLSIRMAAATALPLPTRPHRLTSFARRFVGPAVRRTRSLTWKLTERARLWGTRLNLKCDRRAGRHACSTAPRCRQNEPGPPGSGRGNCQPPQDCPANTPRRAHAAYQLPHAEPAHPTARQSLPATAKLRPLAQNIRPPGRCQRLWFRRHQCPHYRRRTTNARAGCVRASEAGPVASVSPVPQGTAGWHGAMRHGSMSTRVCRSLMFVPQRRRDVRTSRSASGLVASSNQALADALRNWAATDQVECSGRSLEGRVAFLFTGQGAAAPRNGQKPLPCLPCLS